MWAELAHFGVWKRVWSLGDPVHEPVLVFGFESGSLQLGEGRRLFPGILNWLIDMLISL